VLELELKTVVPDAALLRAALARHGSVRFSGRLLDRRLDQGGALVARDEVLRIRRHEGSDGSVREELGRGRSTARPKATRHGASWRSD